MNYGMSYGIMECLMDLELTNGFVNVAYGFANNVMVVSY